MKTNNEEELLVEADDNVSGESIPIAAEERKVFTDQGDPEIDSLHRKYKRGALVLQPDFQRGYVWDPKKASRLIESILLDIPLPVIYLSQGKDDKEYVIDGQQRLTSFFSFIDGIFPDGKSFKLTGLNAFLELEGKLFMELEQNFQDKIQYYKVRSITFRKESNEDLKFEVFERLNSGSVSLNDQELRNCIYRGNYNDLIKELAKEKLFKELLGMKGPDRRMRDVEFVLRFCAFYRNGYQNYKPSMKKFLNREMEQNRKLDNMQIEELRSAFKAAVKHINSLLKENAFKRFYRGDKKKVHGYWEKKRLNASLFDILMDSMARIDSNRLYAHLDAIREAFLDLMTGNEEFIDAIELSTSATQAIRKRFTLWNQALEAVIGLEEVQPRCFTRELKEQLYKANPTCAICGQRIITQDDAAVDHIEQYWHGGKTIPENARLTHRYCNMARSRNEMMNASNEPVDIITKTLAVNPNGKKMGERGCTVDDHWYESGIQAVKALIRRGIITHADLPKGSYGAHSWMEKNMNKYGFMYKRAEDK